MANVSNPLNIVPWELGNYEVGIYLPPPHGLANANPLQLNIPKLMPKIPVGKPTKSSTSINKSCYLNQDAISVGSTISIQNYLSTPHQDNRKFANLLLSSGAKLTIEIRNQNPDTRFVTTKIDPSWNP